MQTASKSEILKSSAMFETSAIVSRLTAFITIRIPDFLSASDWIISLRFPLLPPINTLVGTGRLSNPDGARFSITLTFARFCFLQFCFVRFTASGLVSIAYTFISGDIAAASIDIEPVPHPMSKTTEFSTSLSLQIDKCLISSFVIGTLSRIKSSSLNDGASFLGTAFSFRIIPT